jgi:hypothetical protein
LAGKLKGIVPDRGYGEITPPQSIVCIADLLQKIHLTETIGSRKNYLCLRGNLFLVVLG